MSDTYQFSDGFQAKILALLARDKLTYMILGEIIKPMYFRKEVHIDICRILHDYYEMEAQRSKSKGTPVNAPTLEVLLEEVRKLCSGNKGKLKLKNQYIDEMCDLIDMDLSDAEYIKDNIVRFGRRAALEHAILKSVDDIEKNTEDFSEIEERIAKAIRVGEDISDIGTMYFETAKERLTLYSTGSDGVKRIPTGMVGLDKILKGGLGVGELGIVIAPPNRGKTISLINIGAGALLEGKNVFHYTLEMPEPQVARRYDLRLAKKDFSYLKENSDKALIALLNIQKFSRGSLFIKKYKTSACTVDTIRSHLTKVHAEKGIKPDVIIIDYADLVQPKRTYKDKRFELEAVYQDIRDLGYEFGCAVWSASQTNRGGLDKKVITIGDLAESFSKAAVADFMVAMCQSSEEKEEGNFRFYIAKFRDGTANVTLNADIDYSTMTMSVYEHSEV